MILAALCLLGLLSACAPEEVPLLRESVRYDAEGNELGRVQYDYDEQGNRVKYTYVTADGVTADWGAYMFDESGNCVAYKQYADAQTESFSVEAAEGNYLQFPVDNGIRECRQSGMTARYIGYTVDRMLYCESFDEGGLRVGYQRFDANGEEDIAYQADGDRHYLRLRTVGTTLFITEYDAYDTERVQVRYAEESGAMLFYEEFGKYGLCERRVEYLYAGGTLLGHYDAVMDAENVMSVVLYGAQGQKLVERAPRKEGEVLEVFFRETEDDTPVFVVQETSADGNYLTSTRYRVSDGKVVK